MLIRWLLVGIVVALLGLLLRGWFSDVGYFAKEQLQLRVVEQQKDTAGLKVRNENLLTEVKGLRHTLAAVESRARTDLGMIKEGESFFLVVDAD
jgi:cell division protein FtsB